MQAGNNRALIAQQASRGVQFFQVQPAIVIGVRTFLAYDK